MPSGLGVRVSAVTVTCSSPPAGMVRVAGSTVNSPGTAGTPDGSRISRVSWRVTGLDPRF
jgi:hypothetical protein